MAEKVTVMILDVDLKCSCCFKKVKKVLCQFPQIRDQVFDEDKNKVMIKVVCCNPEKIRDMLCCKGGKSIRSIEIVENKPKQTEKPKVIDKKPCDAKPVPVASPIEPDSGPIMPPVVPQREPVMMPNPKPGNPKPFPVSACCQECSEGQGGGPCHYGFRRPVSPPPGPQPFPVSMCCQECSEGQGGGPCHGFRRPVPPPPPRAQPFPVSACCQECSEGQGGGPCHYGFRRPVTPPPGPQPFPVSVCCQECSEGQGGGPCHDGFRRPVPPRPGPCYDGYGYQYGAQRPCYASRCDYFSEENPQGCSIM